MAEEEKKEGEAAPAEGEQAPPKKSPLKLILFIAGPIVLIGIIAAVLFFTGIIGGKKDKHDKKDKAKTEAIAKKAHEEDEEKEDEEKEEKEEKKDDKKEGHGGPEVAYFDINDLLINLNSEGKKAHFLKISVSMELKKAEDKAKLEKLKPKIIDQFQVYLRELRVEDLRGSAGLQKIRSELLLRVSTIVAPVKIKDLYFRDMLVQ